MDICRMNGFTYVMRMFCMLSTPAMTTWSAQASGPGTVRVSLARTGMDVLLASLALRWWLVDFHLLKMLYSFLSENTVMKICYLYTDLYGCRDITDANVLEVAQDGNSPLLFFKVEISEGPKLNGLWISRDVMLFSSRCEDIKFTVQS